MTLMKINWKRRISFFNSIRSFRWPRRLRPWRTLRWGQRQPLEDAFFHPRKWFPLTSSSLREFPYLSALDFCHSLVELDICSSLKLKCSLFKTKNSQATAGINIEFRLEKKNQLYHKLILFFQFEKTWFCKTQISSTDNDGYKIFMKYSVVSTDI